MFIFVLKGDIPQYVARAHARANTHTHTPFAQRTGGPHANTWCVQTERHTNRTFSYFELVVVMMLIVMTIMMMIEIRVCSTTSSYSS